jgi:DNA-directed RNA polymerase subunit omega
MARITVEDCLEKVENQYDLVLLAKERTVQLNAGSPMLVEEDNDKRTIISLREIGDGKIEVKKILKKILTTNLRICTKVKFQKAVLRYYPQKELEESLKLKNLA